MLSNMDMHKNFYIRGVVNSLLPEFMNPLDKEITESNISGESLEALRTVATTLYPDMKEGDVEEIGLDQILSVFKVDDKGHGFKTHMSLGNFGLTKINGEYNIFDTYDFEPMGGIEFVKKFAREIGGGGIATALPEFIGGILMPENPDGSSREDAMKVRIRIPNEPQVVDMDFDNDIEPTASTFVFEGPMTNKRKKLWDTFTSMFITPAEAGQLDTDFSKQMLDRGIVTPSELEGIRSARPDMYKKLYNDYTENLPIEVSPPPMRTE